MSDTARILLVEDNPDDAELSLRAFARQGYRDRVSHFEDGLELVDYLRGAQADEPPGLILLDLKMPKLDGLGTLDAIRAMPRSRHVPVVVISSSNQQSDIGASYAAGANSYVRKPVDYDQFSNALRSITDYWLGLNETAS